MSLIGSMGRLIAIAQGGHIRPWEWAFEIAFLAFLAAGMVWLYVTGNPGEVRGRDRPGDVGSAGRRSWLLLGRRLAYRLRAGPRALHAAPHAHSHGPRWYRPGVPRGHRPGYVRESRDRAAYVRVEGSVLGGSARVHGPGGGDRFPARRPLAPQLRHRRDDVESHPPDDDRGSLVHAGGDGAD